MNKQTLIISSIVGLLTFSLGWFTHEMKEFADGVRVDAKNFDSLKKANQNFGTFTQQKFDSLMIVLNINNSTNNFATKISGRFIFKDSNCSGFNFISSNKVSWTNEVDCGQPDTLKLRWLDNATFYTQDIIRINENCPPRVNIYQVVSFDGKQLILKDIWTGWDFKTKSDKINQDNRLEFIKRTD